MVDLNTLILSTYTQLYQAISQDYCTFRSGNGATHEIDSPWNRLYCLRCPLEEAMETGNTQ